MGGFHGRFLIKVKKSGRGKDGSQSCFHAVGESVAGSPLFQCIIDITLISLFVGIPSECLPHQGAKPYSHSLLHVLIFWWRGKALHPDADAIGFEIRAFDNGLRQAKETFE